MTAAGGKSLPLVSVIIPAFNNGRFVGAALESLFGQTYPEDRREIIVVDDGSTDDTQEVLTKHRKRIVQIQQQHQGIASARNVGMSHAAGDIVTFLDSDDLWYEERLRRLAERFMENPRTGMVYHPIELIDSDGVTIEEDFCAAFGYEGLSGWVGNEMASGRIFLGGSSFAFRRDICGELFPLPEDVRRGVDYYMSVISSCFAPAEYVPQILGKYRLHSSNFTMSAKVDERIILASINKDFAYTRQKIMEKISCLGDTCAKTLDMNILKRLQAKELIFSHALAGERMKAIKMIPRLFRGSPSLEELSKGVAVGSMALFIPARLYPEIVGACRFLKRLKNVTHR